MSMNPPTTPDTTAPTVPPDAMSAILQMIAPNISQTISDRATLVANDVAGQLHTESLMKIAEVGTRITGVEAMVAPQIQAAVLSAIPQIKRDVLADVSAISGSIQHDPITQRHMALVVVGVLAATAFAIVVAYLAGSPQAKGIVGWAVAPGALGAILAWATVGFRLPTLRTVK